MQNYEIRLVQKAGPRVRWSHYVNDYAAVRSARLMAEPGEGIEIWRNMECIYKYGPHIEGISAFR